MLSSRHILCILAVISPIGAFSVTVQPHHPLAHYPEHANNRPNKVIYGTDDRQDYHQVQDSNMKRVAEGVVAVLSKHSIAQNEDGTYRMGTSTYTFRGGLPLCSDERFYGQMTSPWCSGFLVASDIVVTAGHCLSPPSSTGATCESVRFVFDFRIESVGEKPNVASIPEDNVYRCSEVIAGELSYPADWVVIRLDRSVPRRPFVVSEASRLPQLGESLVVMGHPSGLPLKITPGGVVRQFNRETKVITTNTDTYGGNSGSVVLYRDTLTVAGILVRGATDFEERPGAACIQSARQAQTAAGEHVSAIHQFIHTLRTVMNGPGTPPPSSPTTLPPSPVVPVPAIPTEVPSTPTLPTGDNCRPGYQCEAVTGLTGVLRSDSPYQPNTRKLYHFQYNGSHGPHSSTFCSTHIHFNNLDVEHSQNCMYDHISFVATDTNTTITRLCTPTTDSHTAGLPSFTLPFSVWTVAWSTDTSVEGSGWEFKWEVECNAAICQSDHCVHLTESSGSVRPPYDALTNLYLNHQMKQYVRLQNTAEYNCRTEFTLYQFNVEDSRPHCVYDYLKIHVLSNANNNNEALIGHPQNHQLVETVTKLCGPRQNGYKLWVRSGAWVATWKTDYSEVSLPWTMSWSVVCHSKTDGAQFPVDNGPMPPTEIQSGGVQYSTDHPCQGFLAEECKSFGGLRGTLSPPLTTEGYYQHNVQKLFIHQATTGKCTSLWFDLMNVESENTEMLQHPTHHSSASSNRCSFDWLQITDLSGINRDTYRNSSSGRICGFLDAPFEVYVPSAHWQLHWFTDSNIQKLGGWFVHWTILDDYADCQRLSKVAALSRIPGTTHTQQQHTGGSNNEPQTRQINIFRMNSGSIQHPMYPVQTYNNNDDVQWRIQPGLLREAVNCFIVINVEWLSTEKEFDVIEIFGNRVSEANLQSHDDTIMSEHGQELLWRSSGNLHGIIVDGKYNQFIDIHFKSDSTVTLDGFVLNYHVDCGSATFKDTCSDSPSCQVVTEISSTVPLPIPTYNEQQSLVTAVVPKDQGCFTVLSWSFPSTQQQQPQWQLFIHGGPTQHYPLFYVADQYQQSSTVVLSQPFVLVRLTSNELSHHTASVMRLMISIHVHCGDPVWMDPSLTSSISTELVDTAHMIPDLALTDNQKSYLARETIQQCQKGYGCHIKVLKAKRDFISSIEDVWLPTWHYDSNQAYTWFLQPSNLTCPDCSVVLRIKQYKLQLPNCNPNITCNNCLPMERPGKQPCYCRDYISVFDGVSVLSPSLGVHCGISHIPVQYQSSTPYMTIQFHSDEAITDVGFIAEYTLQCPSSCSSSGRQVF